MAKGDDAIRRKKNKINRKKLRNDSSTVSSRVAAIIASKQRRKSGKRRMCEGMCFSLPTPEDPFNDRYSNKSSGRKKVKELQPPKDDAGMSHVQKGVKAQKGFPGKNPEKKEEQKPKRQKVSNSKNDQSKSPASLSHKEQTITADQGKTRAELLTNGVDVHAPQKGPNEIFDRPSKFLIVCLNTIQNALLHDGIFHADRNKPLLANLWGVEFWKHYSLGFDILDTTGACSNREQIAWILSTAADTIARKEKEGLSIASPFLLFLVSSQEEAIKVRSVCIPLKSLGIHMVSIHSAAPLDHQIQGFKSCEPEFLVSTPERLLELVSLGAIDISGVSLLIVDGLETFIRGGLLDEIKNIKKSVSMNAQTLIFNDCPGHVSASAMQNFLTRPIRRLSLSDSMIGQSACIIQNVHVTASEDEKLSKGVEVLDQICNNQHCSRLLKALFIAETDIKTQTLCTDLRAKGYSISNNSICESSQDASSGGRAAVSVTGIENIGKIDIEEFEAVIIIDFPPTIDDYVGILTKMARYTTNGVLHSFFSQEDVEMAGQLIEVLEKCCQTVPQSLRNLLNSTSISEH